MADTATQAVEHASLTDKFSSMNEQQLRDYASQNYNVNIDGGLKRDAIVKYLKDVHEQTRAVADKLNKKSAQLFLDREPKEPIVNVKFLPLDFPNALVQFPYDGGYGIQGKGSPKLKQGQPKRLKGVPIFKLVPGETYKLPLVVVRHLESLTYKDSKPVIDKETGMVSGNMPVIKPRFMMQIIMSDEQMRSMSTTL
jgi:hypothetical protein